MKSVGLLNISNGVCGQSGIGMVPLSNKSLGFSLLEVMVSVDRQASTWYHTKVRALALLNEDNGVSVQAGIYVVAYRSKTVGSA